MSEPAISAVPSYDVQNQFSSFYMDCERRGLLVISTFLLLFSGGAGSSLGNSRTDLSVFDKDFECSVCLDEMRPPVKIFQCKNGHVMCESCKNHPEVTTCPTCRIPLPGPNSLMRNIPVSGVVMHIKGQRVFW